MTNNVIEARNIAKQYHLGSNISWFTKNKKEFWALDDVSFDLRAGEAVGIIGENGAGKSTLLKILSRITAPTKGEIKIVGKVRSILEVGLGFQAELTGRENIYLNGAMLGMTYKEIKAKFDEIVAFSEVEKFIDTPVKRYSTGMYVRLAFSVAAHLNPDILIIDEVLAVGDVNFQRRCLEKLDNEAHANGRTILFVSHNLTAIRNFCKRALLLKSGKLLMDGPVTEVVEKFLSNISTTINLTERNILDRLNRTTGKVRFSSIRILDKNNQESWRYKTGEAINILLGYEVFESVPSLSLQFSIRTLDKKILTTCKHVISENSLEKGHKGTTHLHIPKLPLCPGEFGFYIYFLDHASSYNHDVIDESSTPYLIISGSEEELETSNNSGYFAMEYSFQNL